MTGFRVGRRTRLNAGTLSVFLTHPMGWPGLLELSVEALFRKLKHGKNFEAYSVEEICLEARLRRLLVATDGEVRWMNSPLHYRVRPNALRVIVPQNRAG
jgi:diacylglycerol kinase family enzyme